LESKQLQIFVIDFTIFLKLYSSIILVLLETCHIKKQLGLPSDDWFTTLLFCHLRRVLTISWTIHTKFHEKAGQRSPFRAKTCNSNSLCTQTYSLTFGVPPSSSWGKYIHWSEKMPRSIAWKGMVLIASDLNHFQNVLLTQISMVTYRLTTHRILITMVRYTLTFIDPFTLAAQIHALTFEPGC